MVVVVDGVFEFDEYVVVYFVVGNVEGFGVGCFQGGVEVVLEDDFGDEVVEGEEVQVEMYVGMMQDLLVIGQLGDECFYVVFFRVCVLYWWFFF